MGSPFIQDFFVSDSHARRLYEAIRGGFKGAAWTPTPLDDAKLGKKGFAKWWKEEYESLRHKLGDQKNVLDGARDSVVEKLELLDATIAGKELEIPVGDIAMALSNSLVKMKTLADGLAKKLPKAADRIVAFNDVCFSAGMSAAALVENAQRTENQQQRGERPEALRETFEQIVVRDVAGSLHEMVGDPPAAFFLSPTVKGETYLGSACAGIDIPRIYKDSETPDLKLIRLMMNAKEADAILKKATATDAERTANEAKRSEALTELAATLREVSERTRELVMQKSSRSGPAVEFAMVAVEATRDVLGMSHRGAGRLGAWDLDERRKAARERAEEFREREKRRDRERR